MCPDCALRMLRREPLALAIELSGLGGLDTSFLS